MNLYDRAAIIPGRSATCSKAPDRLLKAWAAGGNGAVVWDTDGREYIDMLCALGAVGLGYYLLKTRTSFGVYSLPHRLEVEAAEAILKYVAPWASSVRLLKTGSEATHCAYRVAKAATGRDLVLVGDWAYHGWHEWCRPPVRTFGHGNHLSNWWNRAPTAEHVTQAEAWAPESIAAVFVEPHRFEPVDVGWLRSVRAFCDQHGILLVFDSMIYGGRHALGGTSEYFGVQPDLECFGKAMANGEACAFVVGNEALATHGEIASGTYSGCATGLQAIVDTLHTYTTEPVIETLWARGRQLADGLDRVLADYRGLAVREGLPVHQRVRFLADHAVQGKRFTAAMAERGVLWHPDVCNVMYAHTPAQIDRVIAAAAESLKEMA